MSPSRELAQRLLLGALGLCLAVQTCAARLVHRRGGRLPLLRASPPPSSAPRWRGRRCSRMSSAMSSVAGFIEAHELRDKGRATDHACGSSPSATWSRTQRPYRVRVSMPAEGCRRAQGSARPSRCRRRFSRRPSRSSRAASISRAKPGSPGSAPPATRRARSPPSTEAPAPPWDLAAWARVDAVRAAVNARIRAALPGETGEIAAALITGERGGISEDVTEAMRDSGLAHILSISGLHMVIMAGTVFWLVRALLALVPDLRSATRSRNGPPLRRLPPPPSISRCPAPPCPRCARGS